MTEKKELFLDVETQEVVSREETEGGTNIVFRDGRKRGIEAWSESRFLPLKELESEAQAASAAQVEPVASEGVVTAADGQV